MPVKNTWIIFITARGQNTENDGIGPNIHMKSANMINFMNKIWERRRPY